MRLRGLIVAVLISTALLPAQSANQIAFDAWFDQFKKNYDRSIAEFTKVIRLTPKDADLLFGRGISYQGKGNYGAAIGDYNQAILLKPGLREEVLFERGRCYGATGQYDLALSDFTEVIRLNPDQALAFYERGVIWEVRGELGKALEEYDRAIRAFSDYPDAYGARGRIYEKKGDFDSAVRDLDLAIAGDPRVADWFLYRGLTHIGRGEYDLAVEDFNKAVGMDVDADTFLAQGGIYDDKSDFGDWVLAYHAQIFLFRGQAYRRKGDNVHARQDLKRAAQFDPKLTGRVEAELKEMQGSK